MSGTRIPEGFPLKTGALKPVTDGKNQKMAAGVNAPVEARNSQVPQSPLPSQKTPLALSGFRNQAPSAGEVFKQAALNLGLPQDNLSVALLVFSRYFSLPIKPALIAQLRREILSTGTPSSSGEKALAEPEALAAVIATDKGVALKPEALSRYASYLLPPVSPVDGEKNRDKGKDRDNRDEAPKPEELRAMADGQEQTDDLLSLLNSIPGKDGQHWMVIPFCIKVKGTELNVFIRILKKGVFSADEGEDLIVDVSGPKRQWRCFIKKQRDKFLADIQVYPECSKKNLDAFKKEAELFLKKGNALMGDMKDFAEIRVRNGDKIPSWTEDLSAICLPFISKDV